MVTVAWDTSALRVQTSGGLVCTSCCVVPLCDGQSCITYCASCFGSNAAPRYMAVTFTGVYRCSTSSLWTNLNGTTFCLDYNFAGHACGWHLSTTIDGTDIEIFYAADNAPFTPTGSIVRIINTTTSEIWFWDRYATTCETSFTNDYIASDCGNAGQYGYTIRGYGGSVAVVNPCA